MAQNCITVAPLDGTDQTHGRVKLHIDEAGLINEGLNVFLLSLFDDALKAFVFEDYLEWYLLIIDKARKATVDIATNRILWCILWCSTRVDRLLTAKSTFKVKFISFILLTRLLGEGLRWLETPRKNDDPVRLHIEHFLHALLLFCGHMILQKLFHLCPRLRVHTVGYNNHVDDKARLCHGEVDTGCLEAIHIVPHVDKAIRIADQLAYYQQG